MKIEEALNKIRKFHRRYRRIPSYQEMCKLLDYSSKQGVARLVEKLVKSGFLEKDNKGRLSLKRTFLPLPLLSTIKAGYPEPAEEQLIDTMTFDDYLVDNPEDSYLLKVTGDSMINANIQENDVVIVDKKKRPREGDVVVGFIDNEFTLKYLQKKNGKICLVPANPKYPTIYPKNSLTIEGVVVSIIRKYR
jgi:repressor LexA